MLNLRSITEIYDDPHTSSLLLPWPTSSTSAPERFSSQSLRFCYVLTFTHSFCVCYYINIYALFLCVLTLRSLTEIYDGPRTSSLLLPWPTSSTSAPERLSSQSLRFLLCINIYALFFCVLLY